MNFSNSNFSLGSRQIENISISIANSSNFRTPNSSFAASTRSDTIHPPLAPYLYPLRSYFTAEAATAVVPTASSSAASLPASPNFQVSSSYQLSTLASSSSSSSRSASVSSTSFSSSSLTSSQSVIGFDQPLPPTFYPSQQSFPNALLHPPPSSSRLQSSVSSSYSSEQHRPPASPPYRPRWERVRDQQSSPVQQSGLGIFDLSKDEDLPDISSPEPLIPKAKSSSSASSPSRISGGERSMSETEDEQKREEEKRAEQERLHAQRLSNSIALTLPVTALSRELSTAVPALAASPIPSTSSSSSSCDNSSSTTSLSSCTSSSLSSLSVNSVPSSSSRSCSPLSVNHFVNLFPTFMPEQEVLTKSAQLLEMSKAFVQQMSVEWKQMHTQHLQEQQQQERTATSILTTSQWTNEHVTRHSTQLASSQIAGQQSQSEGPLSPPSTHQPGDPLLPALAPTYSSPNTPSPASSVEATAALSARIADSSLPSIRRLSTASSLSSFTSPPSPAVAAEPAPSLAQASKSAREEKLDDETESETDSVLDGESFMSAPKLSSKAITVTNVVPLQPSSSSTSLSNQPKMESSFESLSRDDDDRDQRRIQVDTAAPESVEAGELDESVNSSCSPASVASTTSRSCSSSSSSSSSSLSNSSFSSRSSSRLSTPTSSRSGSSSALSAPLSSSIRKPRMFPGVAKMSSIDSGARMYLDLPLPRIRLLNTSSPSPIPSDEDEPDSGGTSNDRFHSEADEPMIGGHRRIGSGLKMKSSKQSRHRARTAEMKTPKGRPEYFSGPSFPDSLDSDSDSESDDAANIIAARYLNRESTTRCTKFR